MIYLNVSYDQKEHAKSLGAKWDAQKKKWYAPDESFTDLIETYSDSATASSSQQKSGGVRINKIPYGGVGGGGGGGATSVSKSKVSIHKANHPTSSSSSSSNRQECFFEDDD